jgi:CDP-glucose 4,6-dehydratase
MFWKNKNVFVTGGTGFIGFGIVQELVKQGANVIVLVRDITPTYEKLKNVRAIVQGDLLDYDLLLRTLNEYSVDTIFHLAAQAIVTVANKSPISTFDSNIRGTWNLLEAARNTKSIQRMVVASSDKAYGIHKELPYTEDFKLNGIYPYDASKVCQDVLTRTYFKTYGLPVAVTRCANIYGEGDLNFSRIVPDVIQALINDKRPVIRSDGSPERDYMHLSDCVNAYLTIAEQIDKVKGEAVNFGTGKPVSVLDITNKLIQVSSKNIQPDVQGKGVPEAEIDRQYLDVTKAKQLLNWETKISLEEGLKLTWDWYVKNKDFWEKALNS